MPDVVQISIVTLSPNADVSILQPQSLANNRIVPDDWQLAEPPMIMPPIAKLSYSNGVAISMNGEKLQVSDNNPPPHAAWFYGEHQGVQIQYSFVPTLFVAGYDPLFHDYSGDEVLDRVLDFIHPWARRHELNYNILDLALPSTVGWEKGLDLNLVDRLHEYAVASHSFEVKSTTHFTVTSSFDSPTEASLSDDTSVLLPRLDDEEAQLKLMERVVGQMIEDSVELESQIVEMVDEEFWNLF